MKIKLDENLPSSLVADLSALGHDVDTAPAEGLTGCPDPDVWRAAQTAERFLITIWIFRTYVLSRPEPTTEFCSSGCISPVVQRCALEFGSCSSVRRWTHGRAASSWRPLPRFESERPNRVDACGARTVICQWGLRA